MIARTSSFTTVNGTILSLMVNAMCLPPGNLPAWRCWGRQEKSNITFNHFHPLYPNPHLSFPLNTSAGHVFFCEKISFHPLAQNLNPNLTSTPPTKTPKTKHPPSSLGWRTPPPPICRLPRQPTTSASQVIKASFRRHGIILNLCWAWVRWPICWEA